MFKLSSVDASFLTPETIRRAATTQHPSPLRPDRNELTNEEKIEGIASHFREIMEILGLDLSDESLAKTPQRIANMYVNEIFSGLDEKNFPRITLLQNKMAHPEQSSMVIVKSSFTSFCEHHFVPMSGEAFVGFIPNKKLIGLSKIPRIIRYFARRPQLQERLTAQIADSLALLLETDDIAVSLSAKHYCVLARGVEDPSNSTTTLALRGDFEKNQGRKQEFFESIRNNAVQQPSSEECC